MLPRRAARYRLEARRLKVTFASNPQRAEGLSSSVRCAIEQARYSSAVLLLPVDLADFGNRRLGPAGIALARVAPCVIARRIGPPYGAPHGGTPLILPRWLFSRALAVTGDRGLRELVNALPAHQRVLVDLPSAAVDVDTLEDLRAARRRLRRFSAGIGTAR